MHLTLFITFLIAASALSRKSIFNFVITWASELHLACVNWLPTQSTHLPELKALVCGANFNKLETSNLYVATGLIHLFVVSGAHLLIVKKILDHALSFLKPKVRAPLSLILLFFYSGVCEFNPPVTRSLIAFILANEFIVGKISWSVPFGIFITGLLTLFINTTWVTSLSLQLSWLIALGLCTGSEFLRENSVLIRQSLNYIFIFPTLLLFQFPHPITILLNVIFAPILEFILFPLALIASFFPISVGIFDIFMTALHAVLSKTEMKTSLASLEKNDFFIILNWIFIFLIHIFLHLYFVVKERKKLCLD